MRKELLLQFTKLGVSSCVSRKRLREHSDPISTKTLIEAGLQNSTVTDPPKMNYQSITLSDTNGTVTDPPKTGNSRRTLDPEMISHRQSLNNVLRARRDSDLTDCGKASGCLPGNWTGKQYGAFGDIHAGLREDQRK